MTIPNIEMLRKVWRMSTVDYSMRSRYWNVCNRSEVRVRVWIAYDVDVVIQTMDKLFHLYL